MDNNNPPKTERLDKAELDALLRGPPVDPGHAELWTEKDAEVVFYLFDIYQALQENQWLKSTDITRSVPPSDDDFHDGLADENGCMGALMLLSGNCTTNDLDQTFVRVCTTHNRHCPEQHAAHGWIDKCRKELCRVSEQPVGVALAGCSIPTHRVLDTLVNGALAGDATSTPAVDLQTLFDRYSREEIVTGYHTAANNLRNVISMTVPVLKHSVGHWVRNLGWANGGWIIDDLL
jgi:hypothetical protein